MKLRIWRTGLLAMMVVAPIACKTTKKKSAGAPPPEQKAEDLSPEEEDVCAANLVTLEPLPQVDPAKLGIKDVKVTAVPVAGKKGTNYVAQFTYNDDPQAEDHDVIYYEACLNGGKCSKPSLSGIIRSSGDFEERFKAGRYNLTISACVWENRFKPGSSAANYVKKTLASYPGRSLFCKKGKSMDDGLVRYVHPQNGDKTLAGLMLAQAELESKMHKLVYSIKDDISKYESTDSFHLTNTSNPELVISQHLHNFNALGEMVNVMAVETSAFEEATNAASRSFKRKKDRPSSLNLVKNDPCVTVGDVNDKIEPPVIEDDQEVNPKEVVNTTPDTENKEPTQPSSPDKEPAVDPMVQEKATCEDKGRDWVWKNGRCFHNPNESSPQEITPIIVAEPKPEPVDPETVVTGGPDNGFGAKEGIGVSMIALGGILLPFSVVGTVEGGRASAGVRQGLSLSKESDLYKRFFNAPEVTSRIDGLERAGAANLSTLKTEIKPFAQRGSDPFFKWVGDQIAYRKAQLFGGLTFSDWRTVKGLQIDQYLGTKFTALGKKLGHATDDVTVNNAKGAKGALIAGGVGILISASLITFGALMTSDVLLTTTPTATPNRDLNNLMAKINDKSQQFRSMREMYYKQGKEIDQYLSR